MTNTCTKVFLRRRPYVGGKVSLYLDYYPAIRNPHTNKMTRRETLGIVIYAEPANEMQRRFNQEMEEKAEAIRCIRYQSLDPYGQDPSDDRKVRQGEIHAS